MPTITSLGKLAVEPIDKKMGFTREFETPISVAFDVVAYTPDSKFRVLVQCEPPELYMAFHKMVRDRSEDFDLILTYDHRLLELPNAQLFIPVRAWADPRLETHKRFQVSFLTSSKIYSRAHHMRPLVIDALQEFYDTDLDLFCYRSPPMLPDKNDMFRNAQFHIVCENQLLPDMFTEKILDCFVTRTVPIYYGCTNIDKYFDDSAILQFNTPEELKSILRTLTPNTYRQMLPAIEGNRELSRPYWQHTVHERIEKIIQGYVT